MLNKTTKRHKVTTKTHEMTTRQKKDHGYNKQLHRNPRWPQRNKFTIKGYWEIQDDYKEMLNDYKDS